MGNYAEHISIGVAAVVALFVCHIDVRTFHDPNWPHWRASVRYAWELVLHGLLTYMGLWFIGYLVSSKGSPLDFSLVFLLVGLYAAYRGEEIVRLPPEGWWR